MKEMTMKQVGKEMQKMSVGTTDFAECLRALSVIFKNNGMNDEEMEKVLKSHPNLSK